MVPLQYLRTIEMQLINCEIIIVLAWSENCIIVPEVMMTENQNFK